MRLERLLFQALADDLEAMIARDDYQVGDRLPSVRTLHVERGIATGTVMRSLAELEARGLIEARPRSGYFVKPRHTLAVPRTPSRALRARTVPLPHVTDTFVSASSDPSLVPLGGAVLAEQLVPLRYLRRIARETLSKDAPVFTEYSPPAGEPELRRNIGKQLLTIGVRASAENVVVTSGAMNAMRLAVSVATKRGDTVAVESPTFFALLPMLRDAGLLVVEVATDPQTGINLEALASVAAQRSIAALIVTPNFQNPTGACMPTESKQQLLGLARRYGFHLIEDDVYGDLYFGARRPRPLTALARRDDNIFYCSSFSKTLSAGLRVGFVVSHSQSEALARAQLSSTISVPVFNQRVVARFLADGAYERHLRRLRGALRRQMDAATRAIARHFPRGVELTAPTGGFVLWLRLPNGVSSLKLYELAMEHGVSILPGSVCAIDTRYEHYIRVSCGHPWSERLEGGVRRLAELARTC